MVAGLSSVMATKKSSTKSKPAAKKVAAKRASKRGKADETSAAEAPASPVTDADVRLAVPVIMGTRDAIAAPKFSVFSQDSRERALRIMSALQEKANNSMSTRKPRPARLRTADKAKLLMHPFSSLVRQTVLGSWGTPRNGVTMIVGDEGTGKSTLALCDAAHVMLNTDARVLILECEGKPMTPDRMLQCMHTDPQKAAMMLANVLMDECKILTQLIPKTENWLKIQRDGIKGPKGWLVEPLPDNIPLRVIWDPVSRLLTNAQAQGHVEWDETEKGKAAEVGQGTNLGHSQFLSACSRFLPNLMTKYNASLTMIFSPSVKISMNQNAAKALQQMSEWKRTLAEMTWIGGKAPRGLVSQILLMTLASYITAADKKTIIGKDIRVQSRKASHGQDGRFGRWTLNTTPLKPGVKVLPPPIDYGPGMEDVFALLPHYGFGIDAKTKLAKVSKLNIKGLTLSQIHSFVHSNPELVQQMGRELGIPGYVDLLEDIESGAYQACTGEVSEKDAETLGVAAGSALDGDGDFSDDNDDSEAFDE